MRVAVVVAWRPKHFPDWNGRDRPGGAAVPKKLAYDKGAAPYVGIHIASLLPRHWDIHLYHEMARDVDLDAGWDAAVISTLDYCAPHARWLCREFRQRGVKTIVGGIFPTLNPDYFAGEADAVVVGEAEGVMPRLVADLEKGRLEPHYHAPVPPDLSDLPVPRYDLIETDFTIPMAYEATRGCPFTCSFCVLSAIREPYRRRPISNVLRDIQAVPSGWNWIQRKYVTFWDNNLGADRAYFRELCEALVPLKKFWSTETSFDTITPESARLMGRSGCRLVYVGLESLAAESLTRSNKRQNRIHEYRERLDLLHRNGILVMSLFLMGLDGDTPEYLERLPELIDEVGVDVPVLSLPIPIEKTTFRGELEEAGRLLGGELYDGMDGVHLLFQPKGLDADELEWALFDCMRRVYSPIRVARRMLRRTTDGLFCMLTNTGANLDYRGHQLALAKIGFDRIRARGPWPGGRRVETDKTAIPAFGLPTGETG